MPGWTGEGSICFKCRARKSSLTLSGRDVFWTHPDQRLDHYALLAELRRAGPLKQVWSFPFFESHLIRVDWLHCVDKGVANFFIAGLFDLYLRDRTHGETVARKLLQLWRHLQVYYKGNQVQDRLNALKESMLKTNGTPEISCSASELRALVPFSLCLVDDWVEPLSEEKRLAQRAMRHLACCYDCLSVRSLRKVQGISFDKHPEKAFIVVH